MKDKLIRLKALLLAGTIMVSGVGLSGCGSSESNDDTVIQQERVIQDVTERFGIGEHIISLPVTYDIRNRVVQHEYHPGYEPIGITLKSYGKMLDCFDGGAILFSNTSEVECNATSVGRDGTIEFNEFGTPIDFVDNTADEINGTKIFEEGEHIISVPLPIYIKKSESVQIPSYPGYEIVGVASSSYGEIMPMDGGGVLLLRNTVPVKCVKSDKGFDSLGIPVEKENVKVLN